MNRLVYRRVKYSTVDACGKCTRTIRHHFKPASIFILYPFSFRLFIFPIMAIRYGYLQNYNNQRPGFESDRDNGRGIGELWNSIPGYGVLARQIKACNLSPKTLWQNKANVFEAAWPALSMFYVQKGGGRTSSNPICKENRLFLPKCRWPLAPRPFYPCMLYPYMQVSREILGARASIKFIL